MTLCLAWRDQSGDVHLAADSRVTVATNSVEDVAIKVTRIPCEIFPPAASLSKGQGLIRLDIGMAFAGSHIGAYVIKESLVELLTRLQYIPGTTDVSMDKIAKIVFRAYEDLSKRVCSTSLHKNGICEIYLTALCPKNKNVRVFRFFTNAKTNTHGYKEILINPGLEMAGSGVTCAKSSSNYPTNPLKVLKDVIDNPSVSGVGGAIQYGRVKQNEFVIMGEYSYDSACQPMYMRGGLDVNKLINDSDHDDLFVSPLLFDLNAV